MNERRALVIIIKTPWYKFDIACGVKFPWICWWRLPKFIKCVRITKEIALHTLEKYDEINEYKHIPRIEFYPNEHHAFKVITWGSVMERC